MKEGEGRHGSEYRIAVDSVVCQGREVLPLLGLRQELFAQVQLDYSPTKLVEDNYYNVGRGRAAASCGRSVDYQDHEVAAKAPMGLGDARKPGQWRKDFRGPPSRETEAGQRSAWVGTGSTPTTAKRVNCFRCGRSGHN